MRSFDYNTKTDRGEIVVIGILLALALALLGTLIVGTAAQFMDPSHCELRDDWNFQGDRLVVKQCFAMGFAQGDGEIVEIVRY